MQYLCRLVTPPGGIVLDPFMGSGSTGKAAVKEGFAFVGIEQEEEYFEIACARIRHASGQSGKGQDAPTARTVFIEGSPAAKIPPTDNRQMSLI